MAPEIVQKKDYSGYATDIWSLGIILFVMLTGNYPFKGQTERDLFGKISRGLFHMPETIPFEAKRLITKMLSVDPHKRPSAKEVIFKDNLYSCVKIDGCLFQELLAARSIQTNLC